MSKSFVFYEDWLLAAESIEDPILRCKFFQAIATYALRGEFVEVPSELRIALQIILGQIVRDKEKYNDKVEKRRAAALASHAGPKKSANAAFAASAAVKRNANATDNGSVNADDNAVIIGVNKDKTSPPPNGGGMGIEDYSTCLLKITNICIPEAVSKANYDNQYVWRVLDFGTEYSGKVSDLNQLELSTDGYADALQRLNEQFKPHTDFQIIRLGRAISKMSPQYVQAFMAEYSRCKQESNIVGILLDKAEYIRRGNKITSLVGFLKARG